MKTKVVLVGLIVVALTLVLAGKGFASQNEPDGFRELKWGDPPTKDMVFFVDRGLAKIYQLPNDKMRLGDVPLYRIHYLFYEDRFMRAELSFRRKKNYNLLETICKERYGREGLEEGFYQFNWPGKKAWIGLYYDIVKETGFLSLSSAVITTERYEAEKKSEAEKAEGDW